MAVQPLLEGIMS